jgi:hypothetical protein
MHSVSQCELEKILLHEIRGVRGCETVKWVTTIARAKGDWIVGAMNPGHSDPGYARAAATLIEISLRQIFVLESKTNSNL